MTDLTGRVVGSLRAYRPDGATTTVWSRVTGEHRNDPRYLIAENIHTGVCGLVYRDSIHTVMSASY